MTPERPHEPAVTINALQAHFHQTWDELRRAQEEVTAAQTKVERIQGRLDMVRRLMREAHDGESNVVRPEPARVRMYGGGAVIETKHPTVDWLHLSRSKAVLAMLQEKKKPMGPAELTRELKAVGRIKDEPNFISAALDNLKKRGKVRSLGSGQWVPADQEEVGDERIGDLLGLARPQGGGDE